MFLQDVADGSRIYGQLPAAAQAWIVALGTTGVQPLGTCLTMLHLTATAR